MSDESGREPVEPFEAFEKREVERLKAELAANGRLSPGSRRRLLALARIKELAPSAPRRRRWVPAILFLFTLAGATLLFFTRVPSTAIDLDAEVSEIAFSTTSEHELTLPSQLRELVVAGASEIDTGSLFVPPQCHPTATGLRSVRLKAIGTPGVRSSIGLSGLVVPAASKVAVIHAGRNYRYQWTVLPPTGASPDTPTEVATITTSGSVHIEAGPCRADVSEPSPTPIGVYPPSNGRLDLDVEPSEDSLPSDLNMPIKQLSLFRLANGQAVRPLSTVLLGTVYFDSIPGKERRLRAGERLTFSDSQGTLHILNPLKDRLHVRFTGRVSDIYAGETQGQVSEMPTWFEWLIATHALPVLVGGSLYVFGLILALARWWGIHV